MKPAGNHHHQKTAYVTALTLFGPTAVSASARISEVSTFFSASMMADSSTFFSASLDGRCFSLLGASMDGPSYVVYALKMSGFRVGRAWTFSHFSVACFFAALSSGAASGCVLLSSISAEDLTEVGPNSV
jgi:hypothetical protein